MHMKFITALLIASLCSFAEAQVFPGADEETPARAQYFSWINNTNEGASTAQTLTNLDFFAWLQSEYGMQLDIYAFDAGAIDGKRWYGSTQSEEFKVQFPNGFDPIYKRASELDIRLGIWGGPDGFGDTPEEEKTRTDMMVSLCEEYDFALFKFDTVAGDLRDNKQDAFANMMRRCRNASPDLILLNHRINLGPTALPHATTWLWEGQETYTDVHIVNVIPAPHHRAGALARGLPPELSRLTEDHGVCLSSALDHWDDELVLQAFNRSLILSPQIYCNPWLLADHEFSKLARIFNLARKYRGILPKAEALPEDQYGPHAVSRGDDTTRLITLRNLSWEPIVYDLSVDEGLGLAPTVRPLEVRRLHPFEEILDTLSFGERTQVRVEPFRSALIRVTSKPDFGLLGIPYEIVRDVQGQSVEIDLLGSPGEHYDISLQNAGNFQGANLNGVAVTDLAAPIHIEFDGPSSNSLTHRHLGDMTPIAMPEDAETLYEATVFSADSNALEVRSLERSGPTKFPAVQAARDAFFGQALFTDRGIWDKNLFDGDPETAFYVSNRWPYWWNRDPDDAAVQDGAFRLDFGKVELIDKIVLTTRDEFTLAPVKSGEGIIAEVSTDLQTWTEVRFIAGTEMVLTMGARNVPVRYLRIRDDAPRWLSEVTAFRGDMVLDRTGWRASNLFASYNRLEFTQAWSLSTRLDEIASDSFLAITVPGKTGHESVYAALKVGDAYIGAPDRAPSYPANTWELQVLPVEGNYTFYIPLDPDWVGQELSIVLLGAASAKATKPEVWISRKPVPLATQRLQVIRLSQ